MTQIYIFPQTQRSRLKKRLPMYIHDTHTHSWKSCVYLMDPKAIYANVFYCRCVPREVRSLRTANEACLRIRYRQRRSGKGGLDERNNRDMPTCFFYRFRKIRIGISYKRYRSISIRRFIHSFKDNAFIITMKYLILAHGGERERDAKALPKFSSSFDLYPGFFCNFARAKFSGDASNGEALSIV